VRNHIKAQSDEQFHPELGRFSRYIQVPDKLFGRENQYKQLIDAFERIAVGGSEIICVSGESGLGKSTLINSLFLTDLYAGRSFPSAKGLYFLDIIYTN